MKLTESGYHEEQCKPGGCRLWRCLQMNSPEDLQAAEGIPWISGAAKAQSHLHTPLPAPGCVQHSTAPSHSLVSQFSLGKSNPTEGKNQRVFIFLSLFWTWGGTIRNALSKTTIKFLHIPNLCIKFNQKPLYALHQSKAKQSHFFVFMNLQKWDLCKEHFWWFRQWLCLTAQRIVWCPWKAPSHIHSSVSCEWISRADLPRLEYLRKYPGKHEIKVKTSTLSARPPFLLEGDTHFELRMVFLKPQCKEHEHPNVMCYKEWLALPSTPSTSSSWDIHTQEKW